MDLFANDNELGKACTRCHIFKAVTEFHSCKKNKSGLSGHCKECDAARKAVYRSKNKELVREQARALYRSNPAKRRAAHKAWVAKNPEKWAEAKRRCRSTPKGRLENNIRGYLHKTITKGYKSKPTFQALGYTAAQLMAHLEGLFLPGMSWDNYGEWHVDHIIPLSAFNYVTTDDIDFRRAWSLSNLQPLWASDNIRKHAKLFGEFQPSLAMALPANDNRESNNDAA